MPRETKQVPTGSSCITMTVYAHALTHTLLNTYNKQTYKHIRVHTHTYRERTSFSNYGRDSTEFAETV